MAKEHADEEQFSNSEAALGGADSVEKTTWVPGSGTEPEGKPIAGVTAQVPSGGGVNVGAWLVAAIALVIAIIYAAGIFG